jgi:heat shock protein HslJ
MRIRIVGLLAVTIALQGCSTSGTRERELIIAPAPVACAGDPPATCLQVSESDGDQWLMRSDEIEGFAYEPGYTYEVEVAEPPLKDELAVTPRLALVRVVSKEPGGGVASPLGHGAWRLESIGDDQYGDGEITASFHGGGWVDGFGGCNRYLAAAAVNGEKIKISTPTAGRALCAKAVQDREHEFLAALAKAQSYAIGGETLELKLLDGGPMRFQRGAGQG